jgi:hypothetical protein
MYSGSTLTNYSGAILGAHQKVDRVAHKHLKILTKEAKGFPSIKSVLHFEGKNGPDGIKRKSPARDEPWHFYDPYDEEDTQLLGIMEQHYNELVHMLKKGNPERAAFDAAWLAHSIVDGLTPAHHFPYEEKLSELLGTEVTDRDSIKSKLIIPGDTMRESMKKNWKMWGVGGLMSTHGLFEAGIAIMIAPLHFKKAMPSEKEIMNFIDIGYVEYFKRSAREIALLDMYDMFNEKGWSVKLSRLVRNELAPIMIKTVCLSWYSAMRDAGLLKGNK